MLAARMQRRTKILAGLLLLLGLLWLGYIGCRIIECRSIIDHESSLTHDELCVLCFWRVGTEDFVKETPAFWQIIGGARPVHVYLETWRGGQSATPPLTVKRVQKIAEALRFFGSLEEISVQNAGEEAMALFMGVGRQPNLTKAFSFRVPITDEITKALKGFPRLRALAINTSRFTGQGFPNLPELRNVDFAYSPISIEGLRAIVESPKLTDISVTDPVLIRTHFKEIEAIKASHPQLKGLEFDPPDSPPSVPASQRESAGQAKELFEHGDYRAAEKVLQAMLTSAPNNLYILSNLGVVCFREGTPAKLKQAEEVLLKATTIAPKDAFSQLTLGIVYFSQARYDDSIQSLKRAVELNSKDATTHNYLGLGYSSKGRSQEAAKELGIARELDPSYRESDASPKDIPAKFRIHDT